MSENGRSRRIDVTWLIPQAPLLAVLALLGVPGAILFYPVGQISPPGYEPLVIVLVGFSGWAILYELFLFLTGRRVGS